MVVPEREKGVKSFRIPGIIFRSIIFLIILFIIFLGILSYDYYQMMHQTYKNKHLTIENRQLKEQVELFDRKINTLTEDIERIHIFEKKLRIITGIEKTDTKNPIGGKNIHDSDQAEIKLDKELNSKKNTDIKKTQSKNNIFKILETLDQYQDSPKFLNLKGLYEQKIATNFGMHTGYTFTKEWSDLTKKSFALAGQYAKFDYQFELIKKNLTSLEVNIHELDQHLLDKDSFLKSTPTLLPTRGWITSYYGPRKSHYSGRIKMHEGLDIGAKRGREIIAPADGIVTYSGKKHGFGYFVQLDHGYGIETIYAHASKLEVKRGEKIKRGRLIARVGNTGYSTGPHLHYEVRVNGTPVDPLYFILD